MRFNSELRTPSYFCTRQWMMWKNKKSLAGAAPRGECAKKFLMRAGSAGVFWLLLLLALGCKKSTPANESEKSKPMPTPAPVSSVARIHWLGKKRLANETNGAFFMALWNL